MNRILTIVLAAGLALAARAAEPEGTIALDGKDATLLGGGNIHYQTESNRRCVGHWNGTSNTVRWTFSVPAKMTYRLILVYSCENAQSGSQFEARVANQVLGGTVKGTGGWDQFQELDLGPVMIRKPGDYELALRGTQVPKRAVMNLRAARLVPDR